MATLKNTIINDTGFLRLPQGNTSQRPGFTLQQFTTVGSTTWTAPTGVTSVEVLVVGGGGGGGNDHGGGGGGGGVVYVENYPVTPGTSYTVVVGGGGAGAAAVRSSSALGGSGGNSQFDSLTAIGGGGGGGSSGDPWSSGLAGGSGGGSSGYGNPRTPGQGTPGQGNRGGQGGDNAPDYQGAGGGGAGGPGYNGATTATASAGFPDGGPGKLVPILGTPTYFGGGGGGNSAYQNTGNYGRGGVGGGGRGATNSSSDVGALTAQSGTPNTGGGGGGANRHAAASLHTSSSIGTAGSGGSGIVILAYSTATATRGAIRYNTEASAAEFYSDQKGWTQMTIPFLTRQIITNAYTIGGYKDAITWKNVNRTVAATDVTYDLGDQVDTSFNYKCGFCSKTIHWTFGAANAHATSSNNTTAFNMVTESSYSTPAATNMAQSRGHAGVLFKEHNFGWVTGGGSATIEKFSGATEQFITYSGGSVGDTGASGGSAGGPWGASDENKGIWYRGENGSSYQRTFTFATETGVTRTGLQPGNWNQQKTVQSKLGSAWAGNEGSYLGGNQYRKTNFVADVTVNAGIPKGHTNSGEENYTLGQDHQYAIGTYNGAQNNLAMKFIYGTETSIAGGASMESKAVTGRSSATNGWRS